MVVLTLLIVKRATSKRRPMGSDKSGISIHIYGYQLYLGLNHTPFNQIMNSRVPSRVPMFNVN